MSIFQDAEEKTCTDAFRDIPAPDDLEDTGGDECSACLSLEPGTNADGFEPAEAYGAVIASLRSADARLSDCLAADRTDIPDDFDPVCQRFLDCHEALAAEITAARSALEQCYANSGAFEAWLESGTGSDLRPRFEPCTASFLQDAIAELSGACDALHDLAVRGGKISDDPADGDDDLLEFYKVMERQLEEIFGMEEDKTCDEDESDEDAGRQVRCGERLKAIRASVRGLLSALCA